MADPQAIVSWYHLDNPSAATPAIAYGPVANNGTYSGGLTFGGTAGVTFNGTSGVVTIPDHPSLDLDDWAVWVQFKRGATGAIRTLVSKGDKSYGLQLDATGKPQIVSNGVVLATSGTAIADTTQVHTVLAGRYSGNIAMYQDGAQVINQTVSGNATVANAYPLKLGAHTTAAGASSQFWNGTIIAAAVMAGDAVVNMGPFVGLKLTAGYWLPIPSLLSSWRDPASAATVASSFDVLYANGRAVTSGGVTWSSTNNVPGGTAESAALPLTGSIATVPMPLAPSQNGKATSTTIRGYGLTQTVVDVSTFGQWGLLRLAPNVTLGDHVGSLAATTTLIVPAGHTAATFLRAATGPNATDYAGGSSWTTSAATAQSQLPATGAYLAAQLQLVRTA